MRLWVDIVNSPHVRLFERFLSLFSSDLEEVLVTTRKYGALPDLVQRLISPVLGQRSKILVIGEREADRVGKLKSHLSRVSALADLVSEFEPDAAVSKASPELARVAFGLGVPSVIANDNDESVFVCRLSFPQADSIVVPGSFPDRVILDSGGSLRATKKFRGVFEVAHVLQHFERGPFEPVRPEDLGVEPGGYVVFRPEPFGASYLMGTAGSPQYLREISRRYDIVVIPRGPEDEPLWRREGAKVVSPPVDFMDLASRAAAVVGAGGTMTREAALLGVPAASAFPGREPCVSLELERRGLIYRLNDPADVHDFLDLAGERAAWERRAREYIHSAEDPAKVLWEEVNRVIERRRA